MDSSIADLSRLQRKLIEGLAGRSAFYLTGGAALSAFYLHHRQSQDLDLFVEDPIALDALERQLEQLCAESGWSMVTVQRYPGFRRFIVRDGSDDTLVDTVHEPVAQIVPLAEKPIYAGLRVDSLSDLLANKLCALLGRGDIKDLVDLYFLHRSGVDIIAGLAAAQDKDGGMEPLTLAYVLGGMATDASRLLLIQPVSDDELTAFKERLVERLLTLSWPPEQPLAAS